MAKKLIENAQPKDSDQFNVCGVLIQTRPEKTVSVSEKLAGIDGVEIHHQTDSGQLVVTIEDTETKFASDIITDVHSVKGVLAASLVYHQCENRSEAHEELSQ